MPLRLRKFIGAIALFVLVIVWPLVAMALAQMPLKHLRFQCSRDSWLCARFRRAALGDGCTDVPPANGIAAMQ